VSALRYIASFARSRPLWALCALALVGAFYFLQTRTHSQKVLRVYSWSSYFPEERVRAFEEQHSLSVELSYFSSNEELFSKLVAGASGYDVILPSDYMVSRMAGRKMLRELDHSALPGLKHLSPEFRQVPYDPGLRFSVPYTIGNTGILINTEAVKVPPGEISWEMLLRSPEPAHTSLLDDMREVFAAMLLWKGGDPNERDIHVLASMGKELIFTKGLVTLFSSEPAPLAIKGEVHIAHAYTVHAVQAAAENPAFQFYYPKEGAVAWTDNLAIPIDANHPEEALAFIEFFLDPDNAVEATHTTGLGTPNRSAWEKLPPEEQSDPVLYPSPSQKKRLRYLEDLQGESLQNMNRLWTEMKSG
jgi:spermidine/putrescine transport system substrate-binding protein